MKEYTVNVIGAGLAGSEAAYQLAKRGIKVNLYEMKPEKKSPAHHYDGFAELVCSNSLRSDAPYNAVGLLKNELRKLDSLIMRAAENTKVPAGSALAVNRYEFSDYITNEIKNNPNITVIEKECTEIPEGITIVATGPLTSDAMSGYIGSLIGDDYMHFYDAAAPIVSTESIDMEHAFYGSRYDKGGDDDYINCPMNMEEYTEFYNELVNAKCAHIHEFEDSSVFEGCMPVEVMAKRGFKTLLFGPCKPVGLGDNDAFAVIQLRKEDINARSFNIVGFQTHLTFPEQKRVFSLIPALKNAEYLRYGVMHRNTYLNSPKLLDRFYRLRANTNIYFAGQMTGVEGYIESTASGMYAALCAYKQVKGEEIIPLSADTATGALANYVSSSFSSNFQPMNVTFSIINEADKSVKGGKKGKRDSIVVRALAEVDEFINKFEV